jgi:hypothetical protein
VSTPFAVFRCVDFVVMVSGAVEPIFQALPCSRVRRRPLRPPQPKPTVDPPDAAAAVAVGAAAAAATAVDAAAAQLPLFDSLKHFNRRACR